MFLLNTCTIADVEYSMSTPIKRMWEPIDLGFDTDFYGGRCDAIAETKEGVYMLISKRGDMEVFDLMVTDLNALDIAIVREVCKRKGIPVSRYNKKSDMIKLLGGEVTEEVTTEDN